MKRVPTRGIAGLLVFAGLVTALAAYRRQAVRQTRKQASIDPRQGIDQLRPVRLGGIKQWVLIRGRNRANPVLLFLHGGPGLSLMPFYYLDAALEESFTVVHWDQRGAGKSWRPGLKDMSFDRLEQDTLELVRFLQQELNAGQIYLAGHSLGSVLGLRLAAKHPDSFRAFIGIGQVVNKQLGERLSYRFALESARRAGNPRAIRSLEKIGVPDGNARKMVQERKWVSAFGGNLHGRNRMIWPFLAWAFSSPIVTWRDAIRYTAGLHFSLSTLWESLSGLNLFGEIQQVQVPVFFLEGVHDYVAPSTIAQAYFEMLDAPNGKSLIWFNHSGHWPQLEEPATFCRVLVDEVLKTTEHLSIPVTA